MCARQFNCSWNLFSQRKISTHTANIFGISYVCKSHKKLKYEHYDAADAYASLLIWLGERERDRKGEGERERERGDIMLNFIHREGGRRERERERELRRVL